MEIRLFAEQILFGDSLGDKLVRPPAGEHLTDLVRGEPLRGPPDAPGRAPDVYLWNPGCEEEIAAGAAYQPSRPVLDLEHDLATVFVAIAGGDDVIVVSEPPRGAWKARLQEAGFDLPEFLVASERVPLGDRPVRSLRPWGWSPRASARLGSTSWTSALAPLFDKHQGGELLRTAWVELDEVSGGRILARRVLPEMARSADEALAAASVLRGHGYPHVVFKKALTASGRGQLRFLDEPRPTEEQRGWIQRNAPNGLRIEPWLSRRVDLSFHYDVSSEAVRYRGQVRFVTDRRGRFQSAAVGSSTHGLDSELLRFLTGEGRDPRWMDRVARSVGRVLQEATQSSGYEGPIGVDAFVYEHDGALALHPMVEVNPRWTMGRLALSLKSRGLRGALHVVSKGEARALVQAGAVALTDPETARRHAAMFVPHTAGDRP